MGSEGPSSGQGGCLGPQSVYWGRVAIQSAMGRASAGGGVSFLRDGSVARGGARRGQGGRGKIHSTLHHCARTWAPSRSGHVRNCTHVPMCTHVCLRVSVCAHICVCACVSVCVCMCDSGNVSETQPPALAEASPGGERRFMGAQTHMRRPEPVPAGMHVYIHTCTAGGPSPGWKGRFSAAHHAWTLGSQPQPRERARAAGPAISCVTGPGTSLSLTFLIYKAGLKMTLHRAFWRNNRIQMAKCSAAREVVPRCQGRWHHGPQPAPIDCFRQPDPAPGAPPSKPLR